MINVGIVFGGKSVEHDVSIITYFQVLKGINKEKYKVIPIYMNKNNAFTTSKITGDVKKLAKYKEKNFRRKGNNVYFGRNKIDIVIPLVHGKDLENGVLAGFFKVLGLPTTAPDIYTSSVFHNKYLTKIVLEKNKINVIDYVRVTKEDWLKDENKVYKLFEKNGKRIIKPTNLGSSVAVKKAVNIEDIKVGLENGFKYDGEIIVERCLDSFQEFNQAVYSKKGEIVISKIEEVKNDSHIYAFEDKYEKNDCKRVVPAQIPNNLKNKINKTTKKIIDIFHNQGVIRVDYLYDIKENQLYVNEINVIPGALSYYLFESKDIFFTQLLDDLIIEGLINDEKNNQYINQFTSSIFIKKQINKLK